MVEKTNCPECGIQIDPRGLNGHQGTKSCLYRQDVQHLQENKHIVEISTHPQHRIVQEIDDSKIEKYRTGYTKGFESNPSRNTWAYFSTADEILKASVKKDVEIKMYEENGRMKMEMVGE